MAPFLTGQTGKKMPTILNVRKKDQSALHITETWIYKDVCTKVKQLPIYFGKDMGNLLSRTAGGI